jgi:tetratricopeptide (TPR) repeat protein
MRIKITNGLHSRLKFWLITLLLGVFFFSKAFSQNPILLSYSAHANETGFEFVSVNFSYELSNYMGSAVLRYKANCSQGSSRFQYKGKSYNLNDYPELLSLSKNIRISTTYISFTVSYPDGRAKKDLKVQVLTQNTGGGVLSANSVDLGEVPKDQVNGIRLGFITVTGISYENIYPVTAKIDEMEKKIDQKNKFDILVRQANNQSSSGKYQEALQTLKEAKKMLPDDPSIDSKIQNVEKLLAESQNKEKTKTLLANADQAISSENFVKAKSLLQEAKALDPNNSIINNKINEVERLEADFKNKEDQDKKDELEEPENNQTDDEENTTNKEDDSSTSNQTKEKSSSNESSSKSSETTYSRFTLARQFENEGDYYKNNSQYDLALEKYNQSLRLYDNPTIRKKIEDTEKLQLSAAVLAGLDVVGNAVGELSDQFSSELDYIGVPKSRGLTLLLNGIGTKTPIKMEDVYSASILYSMFRVFAFEFGGTYSESPDFKLKLNISDNSPYNTVMINTKGAGFTANIGASIPIRSFMLYSLVGYDFIMSFENNASESGFSFESSYYDFKPNYFQFNFKSGLLFKIPKTPISLGLTYTLSKINFPEDQYIDMDVNLEYYPGHTFRVEPSFDTEFKFHRFGIELYISQRKNKTYW